MGAGAALAGGSALGIAGTGLNMFMQNKAADASMNAIDAEVRSKQAYYGYLSSTADINARLAEATAERGARNVQRGAAFRFAEMVREGKELTGRQRAALAASGVGAGSATSEDIARDTFRKQKLDEMALRYNADEEASEITRRGKVEAYNFRNEGFGHRLASADARHAGDIQKAQVRIGKTTSLLGGATSIAQQGLSAYGQNRAYRGGY